MKRLLTLTLLLCALVLSASADYTISGAITGCSEGGIVYVGLYDDAALDIPYKGLMLEDSEIKNGVVSFYFLNIPEGTYCIQVFQDWDNDGELNVGASGAPTEAWGNYKNSRPWFSAPTFDDMEFDLTGDLESIVIKIKR